MTVRSRAAILLERARNLAAHGARVGVTRAVSLARRAGMGVLAGGAVLWRCLRRGFAAPYRSVRACAHAGERVASGGARAAWGLVARFLLLVRTVISRTRAWLLSHREARRAQPPGDASYVLRPQRHRGSRARYYVVHVPRGYTARRPRPLVMVLHGCRQNHRDIEAISGFNQIADKEGFIVVYPYITSYRGVRFHNCWGWWFDREIHRGGGEVEDLWQIIEQVRAHYRVYHRRIHVIGLSSGGGMAAAMMVAHCDRIASGAVVAGVPYAERVEAARRHPGLPVRNKPVVSVADAMRREMGARKRLVPLMVIHSHDDLTVDIRAGRNLRDSWGECFGVDTRNGDPARAGHIGAASWEHARYRDQRGKPVIQTLFLRGPGHGWYGGHPGRFSFPDAPDIARLSWRFFRANPMPALTKSALEVEAD